VEEMVEEPRPEHGHGAVGQATERPPRRLLRPRRRGQLRPPGHPLHQLLGHLLVPILVLVLVVVVVPGLDATPQRPPRRGGGVEPEPAQYGAAQVAEVARHGPRHQRRVRRRRAVAQRRLERRHHAPQLAEVALPPALQLRRRDQSAFISKHKHGELATPLHLHIRYARQHNRTDLAEQAEELVLDAVAVVPGGPTQRPVTTTALEPVRISLILVLVVASRQVGHAHDVAQQLLRRPQVPGPAEHGDSHGRRRRRRDTARAAAAAVGGRAESQVQWASTVGPVVGLTVGTVAVAAMLQPERRRLWGWRGLVASLLWRPLVMLLLLRHDHW